jgi:hypothetical protein
MGSAVAKRTAVPRRTPAGDGQSPEQSRPPGKIDILGNKIRHASFEVLAVYAAVQAAAELQSSSLSDFHFWKSLLH